MGYGFLSWLTPFATSVAIYPIHSANRPLFESIMTVTLAASTVFLFGLYVRRAGRISMRSAAAVGALWCAMNIVIDLCLFMEGPMKMTLANYFADIGLAYLALPAITIGSARVRAA